MIVFVVIRDFEKKNIFFDHINYIFLLFLDYLVW